MAKKTRRAAGEQTEQEPTEAELAACAVVLELLRSGRIITYVSDILVERVDETDSPGDPEEVVVTRRFCELVVPSLAGEETAEVLWRAAELIESVRNRVVTDFQRELESDKRPS